MEERGATTVVKEVPKHEEPEHRDVKPERHGQGKSADKDPSNCDWSEDTKITEKHMQYKQSFVSMLEKLEHTKYSHLGRNNVLNNWKELRPCPERRIYLMLYSEKPKERKSEEQQVERMLVKEVVETAQVELAAPVVLGPKKYRSLCFCVNYRTLNAGVVQDSYPLS